MNKICAMCRKSDLLCGACNKLLEEGKISKIDVDLDRAIEKLELNAEFIKTIAYENRIIVIAGKDAGKLIGRSGTNAKKISKILGKEIDVIEEGDEKKMIEKMMRAPTIGINKIYGEQEKYRVRVERRFKPRIKISSSLISKVLGKSVEIIFE